MAPDVLTISPWRETRLKATMQLNALFAALLAAACALARDEVAHLFNLSSPKFSLLLAFFLALSSAYLFKVGFKEPVARGHTAVAGAGNLLTCVTLVVLVIADVFHFSATGSKVLFCVAVVYAVFGVLQLALLLHTGIGYQQAEIVVV